ncbi:MAG: Arc family DNA-binding protein [Bacteroidales bacterium]|nr:Arc family DNA-binding protein [Bacteroidales bacterium]
MQKESKIKNFVLRIDTEMMEAVEQWAADEFRSVNGQIQYILDQALKKAERAPKSKKTKCLKT